MAKRVSELAKYRKEIEQLKVEKRRLQGDKQALAEIIRSLNQVLELAHRELVNIRKYLQETW